MQLATAGYRMKTCICSRGRDTGGNKLVLSGMYHRKKDDRVGWGGVERTVLFIPGHNKPLITLISPHGIPAL